MLPVALTIPFKVLKDLRISCVRSFWGRRSRDGLLAFSQLRVASTRPRYIPAPPFQSLKVFSQLASLGQHYMQLCAHVELHMYSHTHSRSELQFELQTKLGHFLSCFHHSAESYCSQTILLSI